MSGHSKWSTIKRKKAATDAKRGNIFTRLAREIVLAAREGGGDLDSNFSLRLAIERAKSSNMPKDNIDRAIKRGTGEDKDAATLEQIMYEGYAASGVALMIEVITDNRNRAVAEVRHTLSRLGGSMADAGSVSWQFERAAYFAVPSESHNAEMIFDLAVEAGAEDVVMGDDDIEIKAPVEAFKQISDKLAKAGIRPSVSEIRMVPKSIISVPANKTLQVMRVMEELEELDDVQNVYSNLEVTDEAVALLETA